MDDQNAFTDVFKPYWKFFFYIVYWHLPVPYN